MGHGEGSGKASGEGSGKGATECLAICGTATCCCLCILIALALAGIGIAKIVIGAVYLHDCDLESMIPIFLIVSGVAPILLGGGANRKNDDDTDSSGSTASTICGVVGLLFSLAWTIAGSVWIYPTWGTVKSDDYVPCAANATDCKSCNDVVLTFAFAMVTIDWIFLGFFIVLFGCTLWRLCKN